MSPADFKEALETEMAILGGCITGVTYYLEEQDMPFDSKMSTALYEQFSRVEKVLEQMPL